MMLYCCAMDWKTVHRANFMGTRMIVDRRQGILGSVPICTVEISRADFKPQQRSPASPVKYLPLCHLGE
jgi:hypothetical protein